MEPFEQGLLPHSMRLWVRSVFKIDQEPGSAPLRPMAEVPRMRRAAIAAP